LLDRPEVADLVIADLARWKDWTVTDRLVEMFKNANEKTQWVRVPIVHFLRVNPDPVAKAKIEELRAVDPQSVRRALAFFELEAAMQTETDSEDAEFEQQLKELEMEKSKEQKEKSQEGAGTGKGPGENRPTEATQPPKIEDSNLDGVRTTAFRPMVESARNSEVSEVALAGLDVVESDSTASEAKGLTTPVAPVAGNETSSLPTGLTANNSAPKTLSARNRSETQIEGTPTNYLWWIVGVPVFVNGLLLVLTWSILNGTFSRLFC
jgi:hypothetical protein